MLQAKKVNTLTRTDYVLVSIFIIAVFSVYIALHSIYRLENPDDACFISIVYNYFTKGIQTEITFGTGTGSGGYGGVLLFGKTYAYIYGSVLDMVGWTKSNAHIISTTFLILASFVWYKIVRIVGFNRRSASFFSLAMLIIEPFFNAANFARPEALCFLIVSCSLLLFLRKKYFLSGCFAILAVEIHPMGMTAILFVLAAFVFHMYKYSLNKREIYRLIISLVIGFISGGIYYYFLHRNNLNLLASTIREGNTGSVKINSPLYEYFFMARYYRHIPELLFFLACIMIYFFKKRFIKNVFISVSLILTLLLSIIIKRSHFMYTIYFYPPLLLLAFWIFQQRNLIKVFTILILLYLIPQYTFVFLENRNFNLDRYIKNVTEIAPKDDIPILGGPNAWFALMDREFYFVDYRKGIESLNLNEFYLIEDNAYREGHYLKAMRYIKDNYSSTQIINLINGENKIVVKKMIKNFKLKRAKAEVGS